MLLTDSAAVVALISGIFGIISSIVLGFLQLRHQKIAAKEATKKSSFEMTPEFMRVIKESNLQEFDIMRGINKELRERIIELEKEIDELEKYKLMYEQLLLKCKEE